jgi:hypothetical protein
MTSALPQLQVSSIPGGAPAPEPPSSDAIGELLGSPSANPELPGPPAPPDKSPPPPQGKQVTPEFF